MYKYIFFDPIKKFFLKREKRFFSYFSDNIIAHCANTGKMRNLLEINSLCLLSKKNTGKLSYTWEAININKTWIGVNTLVPNYLVSLILANNFFSGEIFEKEKLIHKYNYKPDFMSKNIIIEVKHVHLVENNIAYFPDCPTSRGVKQMKALIQLQKEGWKCIVIYIVQRNDVFFVDTSPIYDKEYKYLTEIGKKNGISFLGFNCNINDNFIEIYQQIKVL